MKRIWQKGISLFLVICFAVSLFPAPAFAAWQHGDKGNADFTKILIGKDGKEYYINEDVKTVFYSNNGKKTTKSGNGRKKVRWRYLKISDTTDKGSKYGYCAEFGASFSDQANYKASDSTKRKNLFKALPSDAQKIIAAALCYGRNGSRKVPVSGTNDADYYFATQVLIWEAQQGLRTITKKNGAVTGTKLAAAHSMPAKHMQKFLAGRPAEKCYNWLVKKVNEHLTVHSFASETQASAKVHKMQYNSQTGKWAVTLTDSNKKTNGITLSDSRIKVTKKQYQYTLESSEPFTTALTLTVKNDISGGSASGKLLVWNCTTNEDYQAMIMGSLDLSSSYLKVQTESRPNVTIEKQDAETGLLITASPAVYKVLDSGGRTLIENLRTGSDGKAVIKEELSPGTYQLQEIQAPDGYLLNKEPLTFTVSDTDTVVQQKDAPQKGILKVTKQGERFVPQDGKMVQESIPLEGVVFEILAAEDIITADGTVRLKAGQSAGTITTDAEGKANSGELYLGKYNIVEKEVPEGYLPPEDPITAELHFAGQEETLAITEIAVTNHQEAGEVQIEKTDVSTGQPLPDTGIEILDQDQKVLLQTRTDSDGKAFFENLPVGNYYFREFDAPEGYQIDERPYPFEIKENGEILKCEMTNQKEEIKREEAAPTKPEKPKKMDHSPQTGDFSSFWIGILIFLLAASGGTIFILIHRRKRY